MRSKRPITAAVFCVALVALVLAPGAAGAAKFRVRTLSDPSDTVSEFRPRIAGDVVVWQSGSGSFAEILYWDGTTTLNLSANGVADENPETDGIHIVWQQTNGPQRDLAVFDVLTQGTSLLVSPGDEVLPVVSGTTIAWVELVDADGEVFIDPGPPGNQLTGNVFVESSMILDGDNLVFVQGDDLHLTVGTADDKHDIGIWNGALGDFYILGTPTLDDIRPSISGDTVVWQAGEDGTGDIWYGDTQGTASPLFDGTDERNPHTDGTRVVWDHFDGSDRDVYFVNLASPGVVSQITSDNSADDVTPQIEGNKIVWVRKSTPGDSEIWVSWKGDPVAPLLQTVGNGRDDVRPQLEGDHIVWESCANLGQPSELCDVLLAPEPRSTLLAAAVLASLLGLANRSARLALERAGARRPR